MPHSFCLTLTLLLRSTSRHQRSLDAAVLDDWRYRLAPLNRSEMNQRELVPLRGAHRSQVETSANLTGGIDGKRHHHEHRRLASRVLEEMNTYVFNSHLLHEHLHALAGEWTIWCAKAAEHIPCDRL